LTFTELLEKTTMIDLDDEKLAFFLDRTNNHIRLVKKAAAILVKEYAELAELLKNVELHDASKFVEPELSPYIELTWQKKHKSEVSKETEEGITQATLHHIKNNPHHPEYWLEDKTKANLSSTNRDESIEVVDASNMPCIDLAEMVCDWVAMSWELGTNTPRQWFNKVKDVRWHFSERQEDLIDRMLKVFEKEIEQK